MTAHAVARDADTGRVKLLEGSKDRLGQLLGDIAVHLVSLVVRGLSRVDVEACAGTKVPRVVLSFDVQSTYMANKTVGKS